MADNIVVNTVKSNVHAQDLRQSVSLLKTFRARLIDLDNALGELIGTGTVAQKQEIADIFGLEDPTSAPQWLHDRVDALKTAIDIAAVNDFQNATVFKD